VARLKAAVVVAVSSGSISLEEACHSYQMSEEEFLAWQRAFETYGVKGLGATFQYREARYARTPKPVSPSENSLQEGFSSAVGEDVKGSSVPASSQGRLHGPPSPRAADAGDLAKARPEPRGQCAQPKVAG
jgi:hypothetical protein